jgi:hypothetical protein
MFPQLAYRRPQFIPTAALAKYGARHAGQHSTASLGHPRAEVFDARPLGADAGGKQERVRQRGGHVCRIVTGRPDDRTDRAYRFGVELAVEFCNPATQVLGNGAAIAESRGLQFLALGVRRSNDDKHTAAVANGEFERSPQCLETQERMQRYGIHLQRAGGRKEGFGVGLARGIDPRFASSNTSTPSFRARSTSLSSA